MPRENFRRMLVGGYDPAQVRAAIDERDERLVLLERQTQELAKRVIETEERLQGAVAGSGAATPGAAPSEVTFDVEAPESPFGRTAAADVEPKALGALSRRLEEIHGQARRQATRIRMSALEDAVQISNRVAELTRLRDELGAKVAGLASKAGITLGSDEEADGGAVGTAPAAPALDGDYSGDFAVDVGPLRDFAQLSGFEDAVRGIEAATEVKVSRFSGGRATVSFKLAEPTDLHRELTRRAPFDFRVRDASATSLTIDVADPMSEASTRAA